MKQRLFKYYLYFKTPGTKSIAHIGPFETYTSAKIWLVHYKLNGGINQYEIKKA